MSALRRLATAGVVWLCVLTGGLALSCVPALAGATHEYLSRITEVPPKGPPPAEEAVALPGPFGTVHALTVDGGELFVSDDNGEDSNYRLDGFGESSGSFVSQFAQIPSLSFLHDGVAVGHASGETQVYVGGDQAGSQDGAVAVFGVAGGLLNVWTGADTPSGSFGCFECNGGDGVAVDGSASLGDWAAGDVYVADPEHGVVDVFAPKAEGKEEYLTRLEGAEPEAGALFTKPLGVAVDQANGDVVVQDEHVVDVFEPVSGVPGAYKFLFDITGTPARSFSEDELSSMTVDGGSDEIYVSTRENGGGVVDQFSSTGAYLGQLTGTPAGPFHQVGPVAVDPGTHRLFVADLRGGALSGVVDVFGADLTIPDAVTQAASGVQPASVTLNGTVNPDGVSLSDCHFDYGPTNSYGQSVPCAQAPGTIGTSSTPVAVSANLTGLAAGAVYHFRLVASNANSVNGPSQGRDQIFGAPQIDGESASGETKTTATLTASVNPDGVDTTYRFEYGPTSAYGTSVPVLDGDIGTGTSDVPLSSELAGLKAGITYHYRVVAANASGTSSGEDETFTTIAPALIDSVTITNVTPTGATVHAQIDPLGSSTTYRFEYGTSTSYGTSTPVPDGDIGSGSGDQSVAQQLTGLTANTTYHVRVVAQNASGIVTGSDHTFVYDTNGGGLPDNRAYELVTPAHKNGALIGATFFGGRPEVSADGSRVMSWSIQCFADAESCYAVRGSIGSPYMFARTAGGWQATALSPPAIQADGVTPMGFDADVGTGLFSRPSPPDGQDDWYGRESDGSFVDIGPVMPPSSGPNRPNGVTGVTVTPDLSHLVWENFNTWPFGATVEANAKQVYEYVGAGGSQPLLVGVSGGSGSTDLISSCGTLVGGGADSHGKLSENGSTVFFTAQACASGTGLNAGVRVPASALYARINESRTVMISARAVEPLCSGVCQASPAGDAYFEGASDDGSKSFFVSTQQLLDTASEDSHGGDGAQGPEGCNTTTGANGCNLYEYDFGSQAGQRLVDVSGGDSSDGPRVRGVVGVSADGSHVYFVAGGVLTAATNTQGQSAHSGADNLYVFERDASHPTGRISFIAALNARDIFEWKGGAFGTGAASVTPDGRFLVFPSSGRLTADDASVSGAEQVFRYDAQTGELVRISIGNDGFDDNGNRSTSTLCGPEACSEDARIAIPGDAVGARRDPTMSDDGAYVFFQSPVALTPGAVNDVRIGASGPNEDTYAQNVYEWHAGHVYLISDGQDVSIDTGQSLSCIVASSVCLLGTDASGSNVFFSTADSLVAQDTDTEYDYYDARICTVADPCSQAAASPSPCQGEACHGVPAAAPGAVDATTATFSGPGNWVSSPVLVTRKKAAIKKHARKVKKRAKRKRGKRSRERRARGRGALRASHAHKGGQS